MRQRLSAWSPSERASKRTVAEENRKKDAHLGLKPGNEAAPQPSSPHSSSPFAPPALHDSLPSVSLETPHRTGVCPHPGLRLPGGSHLRASASRADGGHPHRRDGHGPKCEAGKRLLRVRQWRLDEGHRDSAGPCLLVHLQHPRRQGAEGDADASRRGRPAKRAGRVRRPQGRRLLRQLLGRGLHRGAGTHPGEARAVAHRRGEKRHRAGPSSWKTASRRRRPRQRHQPVDHAPVRPFRVSGLQRPDPQRRLPAAGRPRASGPRVLPGHLSRTWSTSAPSTRPTLRWC